MRSEKREEDNLTQTQRISRRVTWVRSYQLLITVAWGPIRKRFWLSPVGYVQAKRV